MICDYNKKVVQLIPDLIKVPEYEFDVLPIGIHEASMEEIKDSFAFNSRRRALFDGLLHASEELAVAGCPRIYVDGSYVTSKPIPQDFDVCYELGEINRVVLNPVFFEFQEGCAAQKREYGGEFFPISTHTDGTRCYLLDFFQGIRGTDSKKGLVAVALSRNS